MSTSQDAVAALAVGRLFVAANSIIARAVEVDALRALTFGGLLCIAFGADIEGEPYRGDDWTPPGRITAYRLSKITRTPYSTVGRQLSRLDGRGLFQHTGRGLAVSYDELLRLAQARLCPDFRASAEAFLCAFRPAGAVVAEPWCRGAPDSDLVWVMLRTWLVGQRLARAATVDDFRAAMVFAQLYVLAAGGGGREVGGVSVLRLSAMLDAPYETVRRHIDKLRRDGLVERPRSRRVLPSVRAVNGRHLSEMRLRAATAADDLALSLMYGPAR